MPVPPATNSSGPVTASTGSVKLPTAALTTMGAPGDSSVTTAEAVRSVDLDEEFQVTMLRGVVRRRRDRIRRQAIVKGQSDRGRLAGAVGIRDPFKRDAHETSARRGRLIRQQPHVRMLPCVEAPCERQRAREPVTGNRQPGTRNR